MKITIDFQDFWMEDDSANLTDQIKDFIVSKCKQEVWESIKKLVQDHCDVRIKKEIEESIYKQMNVLISENIKTEKIRKRYNNSEMVTMEEWVREEIGRLSIDRQPIHEYVNKAASKIGDELKNRYDLLFASQIVAKMNTNGLLKEDVAKMLIDGTTPK